MRPESIARENLTQRLGPARATPTTPERLGRRLSDSDTARRGAAGVEFVRPTRAEAYGRVAVFVDVAGNR
ncbi:MAG: hypothetical protein JWM12_3384, partial [Ilumatobacteraceae bacterium]|nr:hypothetical protein [Ilumatobacteraceae bacterium]